MNNSHIEIKNNVWRTNPKYHRIAKPKNQPAIANTHHKSRKLKLSKIEDDGNCSQLTPRDDTHFTPTGAHQTPVNALAPKSSPITNSSSVVSASTTELEPGISSGSISSSATFQVTVSSSTTKLPLPSSNSFRIDVNSSTSGLSVLIHVQSFSVRLEEKSVSIHSYEFSTVEALINLKQVFLNFHSKTSLTQITSSQAFSQKAFSPTLSNLQGTENFSNLFL